MNRVRHREWPVWFVWLTLAGASVAGVLLVEGMVSPAVAATTAFVLAALKINLIFGQFMELAWSHWPVRPLLAGWLTAVTAMLLIAYWFS